MPLFPSHASLRTGNAAPSEKPTEGQTIVADYRRRSGLTLERHPMCLLRRHLDRYQLRDRLRAIAGYAATGSENQCGRARDYQAAAGHGQWRHIRHARGRNGADQPGRLEALWPKTYRAEPCSSARLHGCYAASYR